MGKNRNIGYANSINISSSDNTYTTSAGVEVDMEDYDEEFFQHFEKDVSAWIEFGNMPPDFIYTKEEVNYILSHMTDSTNDSSIPSGFLTRVEEARHFQKHDYKVGDTVQDSSAFRSYSRTQDGTLEFIQKYCNEDRPIVIYRTNGNVKHFNASRFNDKYDWEAESFIEQPKMKITGITELNGADLKTLPNELGINRDMSSMENIPKTITIVDVEQTN